jgi:dihydroorotase
VFDVGHGAGSFVFDEARPALEQGFPPDTISTDLHRASMNGGMKDMLNVMSKFLSLGMPIEEVIRASTSSAARAIRRKEIGHLAIGAAADVAILSIREGKFGFVDVEGKRSGGTQKLECELTLHAGKVKWDLNGVSARPQ